LWISTIAVVLVAALQGLSGHWITFYLIWPGGPTLGPEPDFIRAMISLSSFHKVAGFVTGGLSVLITCLVFFSRTSVYVRAFAVVGLVMTALAVIGGVVYVTTGFLDRWSLGQMADASVGVSGAYFIQLFFMNKTPRFPWAEGKPG
jgi:hypothetical protein